MNSDWAANPDDRKSITGYVLFLANSPVSWLTRRQKTVALFSTEAEYMVMSNTTRQISWTKSLLGEIGFSIPKVPLYCDNQGAIFLATKPAQGLQSKTHWNMLPLHLRMCGRRRTRLIPSIFQLENRSQISLPRILRRSSSKTYAKTFV